MCMQQHVLGERRHAFIESLLLVWDLQGPPFRTTNKTALTPGIPRIWAGCRSGLAASTCSSYHRELHRTCEPGCIQDDTACPPQISLLRPRRVECSAEAAAGALRLKQQAMLNRAPAAGGAALVAPLAVLLLLAVTPAVQQQAQRLAGSPMHRVRSHQLVTAAAAAVGPAGVRTRWRRARSAATCNATRQCSIASPANKSASSWPQAPRAACGMCRRRR
jgi:hypothetical protein